MNDYIVRFKYSPQKARKKVRGCRKSKQESLLQKHMKPHCVHYILYRDIGYGTLCSTALSIGVVSARGSRG